MRRSHILRRKIKTVWARIEKNATKRIIEIISHIKKSFQRELRRIHFRPPGRAVRRPAGRLQAIPARLPARG